MTAEKQNWTQFSKLSHDAFETSKALSQYFELAGLNPIEELLVKQHFTPGGSTLDIGCGAGRSTIGLHTSGYKVIGLDLSSTLIEAAQQKYPQIDFRKGDVRALPFDHGHFDQVLFSFNGFDHVGPLDDFRRSLVEIRRVLKPAGTFIYSGHNILGLLGRHLRPWKEFLKIGLPEIASTLASQRRGFRPWTWYWRYKERIGDMVLFSAPPWVHKRLQRSSGFEPLQIMGGLYHPTCLSEKRITLLEHHVHYVARRLS